MTLVTRSARIDLLFTMSDIARAPAKRTTRGLIFSRTNFETAAPSGGARRDRTDDLLLAKQALSQLSYGPDKGSGSRCQASGTSYPDARIPTADSWSWWAWEDLNFRPHAYQARALTN